MRHPRDQSINRALTAALFLALLVPGFACASQFLGTPVDHGKDQCVVLNHFGAESGAKYLPKDAGDEEKLCRAAFDDKAVGLCPKTWSTSPGTIVYDIGKSKYNGHPDVFEAEYCPKQRALKGKVEGIEKIASFKQSVNGQFHQRTSATYAQASPLYYHFSRYFNTTVDVPVAVMRTMDAKEHLRRVASKASGLVRGGMIAAGWDVVISAERDPTGYGPTDEFYYGDPKDDVLYGTMLKGPGTRSGAEFNGNIAGRGYTEQYRFIERTPAFLALSNPRDLAVASAEGLASSKADAVVAKALGVGVAPEQMILWMTELSDILLLDYIFNQQDRPGNIDYTWVWYYLDSGGQLKSIRVDSEASRLAMNSVATPTEVKNVSRSVLVEKIHINDNDAGGRRYTNFTRRAGLLENLHHLNAVTYRQLIRLGEDFQIKGPLYRYLQDTFDLHEGYVLEIAQNVIQAGLVLKKACNDGGLRFDLDPELYLSTAHIQSPKLDCEAPK